jgi:hypothetical protein
MKPSGTSNTVLANLFATFIGVSILYLLFLPKPAHAFVSIESTDGKYSLDINGALVLNGGYYSDSSGLLDNTNGGMNSSSVRFIAMGTLFKNLDFELDGFGWVSSNKPYVDGAFAGISYTASSYRTRWLSSYYFYQYSAPGSVSGGYGWDRMFLRYNFERTSISLGRMPLNYSVASGFTINDFFVPFSASSINTVYKPGVDAMTVTVQTGNLSNIELIGALGNDQAYDPLEGSFTWADSAVLAYARTVLFNIELALIGGKLAGKWIVGGSLQADAGRVSLYTEGHVGFPDKDGDLYMDIKDGSNKIHTKLVTGFRFMFNKRNATLGGEYAFFSNGVNPEEYVLDLVTATYPDELPYSGKHYGSISYGIELHPLINIAGMALMNFTDLSGLLSASLAFSIGDNADLVAGALIPWGKGPTQTDDFWPEFQSEFGTSPITGFTELRYYF